MEPIASFLFGVEPIAWIQHFFGLGHPLPFRIFSLIGDSWGMILVIGLAFWLFGRERLYATCSVVVAGGPSWEHPLFSRGSGGDLPGRGDPPGGPPRTPSVRGRAPPPP